MKNSQRPGKVFIVWALTSVYAAFGLLWSAHHFIAPEHQHEKKICRHAPHEKHFHDEAYSGDDCSICHFLPAQAEPLQFEFLLSHTLIILPTQIPVYSNLSGVSPLSSSQPRAPPVRPA